MAGESERIIAQELPASPSGEAAAIRNWEENLRAAEGATPKDAARAEVEAAIREHLNENSEVPIEVPTPFPQEAPKPATGAGEISADVAEALASIREHAAPERVTQEQPQQQWQGKDTRAGSDNEGKAFPSRRTHAEKWAGVIEGTARVVPPTPQIEIPAPEKVPEPVIVPEAPITPPQAEIPPVEATPAPIEVAAPILPEREPTPSFVPTPDVRSSDAVTLRVTNKIQGREVRGWTLTAEKKPSIATPPPTPEAPPVIPPSPEISVPAPEPIPVVAEAPKGLTPEEVEAAAKAGNPIKVEKQPEPTPAPEKLEEKPAEKKKLPQERVIPVKTIAREWAEKAGREAVRNTREALISMRPGFEELSSVGRSFARKLYNSQPADAVRAVGWRMSIGFNDAVAHYLGEHANVYRGKKEEHEGVIARTRGQQQKENQEMEELIARFGAGVLDNDIKKERDAELELQDKQIRGHGKLAEKAKGKQEKFVAFEGTFIERRNRAAEKLATYVEKRLAPFEKKIEQIRGAKDKFDEEIASLDQNRSRQQVERDRLVAEKERKNMAALPRSHRLLWEKVVREADDQLALTEDVLARRAAARARTEEDLKEVIERSNKVRPQLADARSVAMRERVSDRKLEIPAEPGAPVEAEPSVTEDLELSGFVHEVFGVPSEKIPDLSVEDFIRAWNKYAGEIPITPQEMADFMGVKTTDVISADELTIKLAGRIDAMLADKRKKRIRVDRETAEKYVKHFRKTWLRLAHTA